MIQRKILCCLNIFEKYYHTVFLLKMIDTLQYLSMIINNQQNYFNGIYEANNAGKNV